MPYQAKINRTSLNIIQVRDHRDYLSQRGKTNVMLARVLHERGETMLCIKTAGHTGLSWKLTTMLYIHGFVPITHLWIILR